MLKLRYIQETDEIVIVNESPYMDSNMRMKIDTYDDNVKNKAFWKNIIDTKVCINRGNITFNGKQSKYVSTESENLKTKEKYYRDFFIDGDLIAGIIHYEQLKNGIKIKFVWNGKKYNGLVKHCLVDLYVKYSNMFLTDNTFSSQGKSFLYILLKDLKRKGYKVGFLNETTGDYKENIDLLDYEKYWSKDQEDSVFTITK